LFEPLIRETQPCAKKIAHRVEPSLLRPKSADGKLRHSPSVRCAASRRCNTYVQLVSCCITRLPDHARSGCLSQTQPMPKQMGQFLSMGLGGAFVESLLQLFLRLMIEFLVPALGLTGLLPKLIRAADNINLSGLAHWVLSRRLCRTPSAELGRRKDVTVEARLLNTAQGANSSF
jgi:hypothetical protein